MARKQTSSESKSVLDKPKTPKTVQDEPKKAGKKDANASAYIVASSVFLTGILVAATVFYFGTKILEGIDYIRYPYDPGKPLSTNSLRYYANSEGIDPDWFVDCAKGSTYEDKLKKDLDDAQALGVEGTPGFFIGERIDDSNMRGFLIPGAYPFDTFEVALEAIINEGVDKAFEEMSAEIRDPLYESRFSSYFQYYMQQEGMSEEDARAQADAETSAYIDALWQIREVGFGSIAPLKRGDPKVVIVEFTDFECPYCKRFVTSTFSEIKDKYVDRGKVAYYLRNLPLDFHENAELAAKAAFCANEKGKFWEIHELLFGIEAE